MASYALQQNPAKFEASANPFESVARASLEQRADRTFIDAEWAQELAKLLEFVGILRAWERKTPV